MSDEPAIDPATPPELRAPALEVRRDLLDAVRLVHAPWIVLSGGLDTSILSYLGKGSGLRAASTVLVGEDPPDAEHASAVAQALGLEHHVVQTDLPGLLEELPFAVRVLRTFDPMELRNSMVVARALREVRAHGGSLAVTGDGADELFGGYSFLWTKPEEEFRRSSERMIAVMRFSSFPMGEELGVTVRAPFLDPRVIEVSRRLSKDQKVGEREGSRHGKLLLRYAFPEVPNRWRRKDPIEVGSGSTALPAYFRESSDPATFERQRARILGAEGITIRDPEHLAYYEVFRREFPKGIPLPRGGPGGCVGCGYELRPAGSDFCVTCGAWPARATPAADRRPVLGVP